MTVKNTQHTSCQGSTWPAYAQPLHAARLSHLPGKCREHTYYTAGRSTPEPRTLSWSTLNGVRHRASSEETGDDGAEHEAKRGESGGGEWAYDGEGEAQVGDERCYKELVWEWDEEEQDFHDSYGQLRLPFGFQVFYL